MNIGVSNAKVLQHRALRMAANISEELEKMKNRPLWSYLDPLATGRRPRAFQAHDEDLEMIRTAVTLRASRHGDDVPAKPSSMNSSNGSPTRWIRRPLSFGRSSQRRDGRRRPGASWRWRLPQLCSSRAHRWPPNSCWCLQRTQQRRPLMSRPSEPARSRQPRAMCWARSWPFAASPHGYTSGFPSRTTGGPIKCTLQVSDERP